MSFITLATQAQKELDAETQKLKEKEIALLTKASAVAGQLALAEQRTGELNAREKDLEQRIDDVTRREITLRRDTDIAHDVVVAAGDRKEAEKALKTAQTLTDEVRLEREKLIQREVALSEEKKKYKQEIELEVMRNFTFRK